MARAFAGAHTTLLESWLADDERPPVEAAVELQMRLLTNGFAWALAMIPDEHALNLPPIDIDPPDDEAATVVHHGR
jgi:hypothetical protein